MGTRSAVIVACLLAVLTPCVGSISAGSTRGSASPAAKQRVCLELGPGGGSIACVVTSFSLWNASVEAAAAVQDLCSVAQAVVAANAAAGPAVAPAWEMAQWRPAVARPVSWTSGAVSLPALARACAAPGSLNSLLTAVEGWVMHGSHVPRSALTSSSATAAAAAAVEATVVASGGGLAAVAPKDFLQTTLVALLAERGENGATFVQVSTHVGATGLGSFFF